MQKLITLAILLALNINTQAQEMKRRPFLGISMREITDDMVRVMQLPARKGVLLDKVIAGSTAEKAGFKKGDVLISINGTATNNGAATSSYVATQKNDAFTYELLRDGKTIKGKASFMRFPQEQYPDLEVNYTYAKTNTGLQRIIITKPKTNLNGAVLVFIGGIGCYSMDFAFDTAANELQMLNYLARSGFTTVRIEKPGMGDNKGYSKDCDKISFKEEVNGYVEAIKELEQNRQIPADRLFLFGHSMGGVMAPMVAAQVPVKGIVAYGTIGSNFIEYLLKSRRTIAEAEGWEPDSTDDYIKDCCECAAYYFSEKMSKEQAAAKKPACLEHLSVFDLRSRQYNDELYALNIPALWRSFKGKALLIWGEGDYISCKDDHQIITDALNHYSNGAATFATVAATHGMDYAANFQQARNLGAYNPELGKIVLDWLRKS
jgi:hypothetical protein